MTLTCIWCPGYQWHHLCDYFEYCHVKGQTWKLQHGSVLYVNVVCRAQHVTLYIEFGTNRVPYNALLLLIAIRCHIGIASLPSVRMLDCVSLLSSYTENTCILWNNLGIGGILFFVCLFVRLSVASNIYFFSNWHTVCPRFSYLCVSPNNHFQVIPRLLTAWPWPCDPRWLGGWWWHVIFALCQATQKPFCDHSKWETFCNMYANI